MAAPPPPSTPGARLLPHGSECTMTSPHDSLAWGQQQQQQQSSGGGSSKGYFLQFEAPKAALSARRKRSQSAGSRSSGAGKCRADADASLPSYSSSAAARSSSSRSSSSRSGPNAPEAGGGTGAAVPTRASGPGANGRSSSSKRRREDGGGDGSSSSTSHPKTRAAALRSPASTATGPAAQQRQKRQQQQRQQLPAKAKRSPAATGAAAAAAAPQPLAQPGEVSTISNHERANQTAGANDHPADEQLSNGDDSMVPIDWDMLADECSYLARDLARETLEACDSAAGEESALQSGSCHDELLAVPSWRPEVEDDNDDDDEEDNAQEVTVAAVWGAARGVAAATGYTAIDGSSHGTLCAHPIVGGAFVASGDSVSSVEHTMVDSTNNTSHLSSELDVNAADMPCVDGEVTAGLGSIGLTQGCTAQVFEASTTAEMLSSAVLLRDIECHTANDISDRPTDARDVAISHVERVESTVSIESQHLCISFNLPSVAGCIVDEVSVESFEHSHVVCQPSTCRVETSCAMPELLNSGNMPDEMYRCTDRLEGKIEGDMTTATAEASAAYQMVSPDLQTIDALSAELLYHQTGSISLVDSVITVDPVFQACTTEQPDCLLNNSNNMPLVNFLGTSMAEMDMTTSESDNAKADLPSLLADTAVITALDLRSCTNLAPTLSIREADGSSATLPTHCVINPGQFTSLQACLAEPSDDATNLNAATVPCSIDRSTRNSDKDKSQGCSEGCTQSAEVEYGIAADASFADWPISSDMVDLEQAADRSQPSLDNRCDQCVILDDASSDSIGPAYTLSKLTVPAVPAWPQQGQVLGPNVAAHDSQSNLDEIGKQQEDESTAGDCMPLVLSSLCLSGSTDLAAGGGPAGGVLVTGSNRQAAGVHCQADSLAAFEASEAICMMHANTVAAVAVGNNGSDLEAGRGTAMSLMDRADTAGPALILEDAASDLHEQRAYSPEANERLEHPEEVDPNGFGGQSDCGCRQMPWPNHDDRKKNGPQPDKAGRPASSNRILPSTVSAETTTIATVGATDVGDSSRHSSMASRWINLLKEDLANDEWLSSDDDSAFEAEQLDNVQSPAQRSSLARDREIHEYQDELISQSSADDQDPQQARAAELAHLSAVIVADEDGHEESAEVSGSAAHRKHVAMARVRANAEERRQMSMMCSSSSDDSNNDEDSSGHGASTHSASTAAAAGSAGAQRRHAAITEPLDTSVGCSPAKRLHSSGSSSLAAVTNRSVTDCYATHSTTQVDGSLPLSDGKVEAMSDSESSSSSLSSDPTEDYAWLRQGLATVTASASQGDISAHTKQEPAAASVTHSAASSSESAMPSDHRRQADKNSTQQTQQPVQQQPRPLRGILKNSSARTADLVRDQSASQCDLSVLQMLKNGEPLLGGLSHSKSMPAVYFEEDSAVNRGSDSSAAITGDQPNATAKVQTESRSQPKKAAASSSAKELLQERLQGSIRDWRNMTAQSVEGKIFEWENTGDFHVHIKQAAPLKKEANELEQILKKFASKAEQAAVQDGGEPAKPALARSKSLEVTTAEQQLQPLQQAPDSQVVAQTTSLTLDQVSAPAQAGADAQVLASLLQHAATTTFAAAAVYSATDLIGRVMHDETSMVRASYSAEEEADTTEWLTTGRALASDEQSNDIDLPVVSAGPGLEYITSQVGSTGVDVLAFTNAAVDRNKHEPALVLGTGTDKVPSRALPGAVSSHHDSTARIAGEPTSPGVVHIRTPSADWSQYSHDGAAPYALLEQSELNQEPTLEGYAHDSPEERWQGQQSSCEDDDDTGSLDSDLIQPAVYRSLVSDGFLVHPSTDVCSLAQSEEWHQSEGHVHYDQDKGTKALSGKAGADLCEVQMQKAAESAMAVPLQRGGEQLPSDWDLEGEHSHLSSDEPERDWSTSLCDQGLAGQNERGDVCSKVQLRGLSKWPTGMDLVFTTEDDVVDDASVHYEISDSSEARLQQRETRLPLHSANLCDRKVGITWDDPRTNVDSDNDDRFASASWSGVESASTSTGLSDAQNALCVADTLITVGNEQTTCHDDVVLSYGDLFKDGHRAIDYSEEWDSSYTLPASAESSSFPASLPTMQSLAATATAERSYGQPDYQHLYHSPLKATDVTGLLHPTGFEPATPCAEIDGEMPTASPRLHLNLHTTDAAAFESSSIGDRQAQLNSATPEAKFPVPAKRLSLHKSKLIRQDDVATGIAAPASVTAVADSAAAVADAVAAVADTTAAVARPDRLLPAALLGGQADDEANDVVVILSPQGSESTAEEDHSGSCSLRIAQDFDLTEATEAKTETASNLLPEDAMLASTDAGRIGDPSPGTNSSGGTISTVTALAGASSSMPAPLCLSGVESTSRDSSANRPHAIAENAELYESSPVSSSSMSSKAATTVAPLANESSRKYKVAEFVSHLEAVSKADSTRSKEYLRSFQDSEAKKIATDSTRMSGREAMTTDRWRHSSGGLESTNSMPETVDSSHAHLLQDSAPPVQLHEESLLVYEHHSGSSSSVHRLPSGQMDKPLVSNEDAAGSPPGSNSSIGTASATSAEDSRYKQHTTSVTAKAAKVLDRQSADLACETGVREEEISSSTPGQDFWCQPQPDACGDAARLGIFGSSPAHESARASSMAVHQKEAIRFPEITACQDLWYQAGSGRLSASYDEVVSSRPQTRAASSDIGGSALWRAERSLVDLGQTSTVPRPHAATDHQAMDACASDGSRSVELTASKPSIGFPVFKSSPESAHLLSRSAEDSLANSKVVGCDSSIAAEGANIDMARAHDSESRRSSLRPYAMAKKKVEHRQDASTVTTRPADDVQVQHELSMVAAISTAASALPSADRPGLARVSSLAEECDGREGTAGDQGTRQAAPSSPAAVATVPHVSQAVRAVPMPVVVRATASEWARASRVLAAAAAAAEQTAGGGGTRSAEDKMDAPAASEFGAAASTDRWQKDAELVTLAEPEFTGPDTVDEQQAASAMHDEASLASSQNDAKTTDLERLYQFQEQRRKMLLNRRRDFTLTCDTIEEVHHDDEASPSSTDTDELVCAYSLNASSLIRADDWSSAESDNDNNSSSDPKEGSAQLAQVDTIQQSQVARGALSAIMSARPFVKSSSKTATTSGPNIRPDEPRLHTASNDAKGDSLAQAVTLHAVDFRKVSVPTDTPNYQLHFARPAIVRADEDYESSLSKPVEQWKTGRGIDDKPGGRAARDATVYTREDRTSQTIPELESVGATVSVKNTSLTRGPEPPLYKQAEKCPVEPWLANDKGQTSADDLGKRSPLSVPSHGSAKFDNSGLEATSGSGNSNVKIENSPLPKPADLVSKPRDVFHAAIRNADDRSAVGEYDYARVYRAPPMPKPSIASISSPTSDSYDFHFARPFVDIAGGPKLGASTLEDRSPKNKQTDKDNAHQISSEWTQHLKDAARRSVLSAINNRAGLTSAISSSGSPLLANTPSRKPVPTVHEEQLNAAASYDRTLQSRDPPAVHRQTNVAPSSEPQAATFTGPAQNNKQNSIAAGGVATSDRMVATGQSAAVHVPSRDRVSRSREASVKLPTKRWDDPVVPDRVAASTSQLELDKAKLEDRSRAHSALPPWERSTSLDRSRSGKSRPEQSRTTETSTSVSSLLESRLVQQAPAIITGEPKSSNDGNTYVELRYASSTLPPAEGREAAKTTAAVAHNSRAETLPRSRPGPALNDTRDAKIRAEPAYAELLLPDRTSQQHPSANMADRPSYDRQSRDRIDEVKKPPVAQPAFHRGVTYHGQHQLPRHNTLPANMDKTMGYQGSLAAHTTLPDVVQHQPVQRPHASSARPDSTGMYDFDNVDPLAITAQQSLKRRTKASDEISELEEMYARLEVAVDDLTRRQYVLESIDVVDVCIGSHVENFDRTSAAAGIGHSYRPGYGSNAGGFDPRGAVPPPRPPKTDQTRRPELPLAAKTDRLGPTDIELATAYGKYAAASATKISQPELSGRAVSSSDERYQGNPRSHDLQKLSINSSASMKPPPDMRFQYSMDAQPGFLRGPSSNQQSMAPVRQQPEPQMYPRAERQLTSSPSFQPRLPAVQQPYAYPKSGLGVMSAAPEHAASSLQQVAPPEYVGSGMLQSEQAPIGRSTKGAALLAELYAVRDTPPEPSGYTDMGLSQSHGRTNYVDEPAPRPRDAAVRPRDASVRPRDAAVSSRSEQMPAVASTSAMNPLWIRTDPYAEASLNRDRPAHPNPHAGNYRGDKPASAGSGRFTSSASGPSTSAPLLMPVAATPPREIWL